MIKENLVSKDYKVKECTFSLTKANIIGGFITLLLVAILVIIYYLIYKNGTGHKSIGIIFIFLAGIIIHELIHGFVWHLFCEHKWKSIKFAIDKKTLSPYTTCKEVIPVSAYRIGVIMPGVVTGVLPYIIGLIINSCDLVYASILLICAAVGDFMILFTLIGVGKTSFVEDHPTMCGVQSILKNNWTKYLVKLRRFYYYEKRKTIGA